MTISQTWLMVLCLLQLLHQLSIRPTWGCLAALVTASPCSVKYLGDFRVKAFQFGVKGCYQFKYLLDSHSKIVPILNLKYLQLQPGGDQVELLSDILDLRLHMLQEDPSLLIAAHWATSWRAFVFIFPFFSSLSSFSCWFFPLLLLFLFDWIKTGMPTRVFRLASLRASSFKNASLPKKHPTQKSSRGNSSRAGSLS